VPMIIPIVPINMIEMIEMLINIRGITTRRLNTRLLRTSLYCLHHNHRGLVAWNRLVIIRSCFCTLTLVSCFCSLVRVVLVLVLVLVLVRVVLMLVLLRADRPLLGSSVKAHLGAPLSFASE
jgi:hypothetical protein